MKYAHLWKDTTTEVMTSDGYSNSEFDNQSDALEVLDDFFNNRKYFDYVGTLVTYENGAVRLENWERLLEEWRLHVRVDMDHIMDIKDYYLSTRI